MDEKIIATKSLFTLVQKIISIVLLLIFAIYPSESLIYFYLGLVAYIVSGVLFVFALIQLMEPKTRISSKSKTLLLHYVIRDVVIGFDDIGFIDYRQAQTRGVEHAFGSLIIRTKDLRRYVIKNIQDIVHVHQTITHLMNDRIKKSA